MKRLIAVALTVLGLSVAVQGVAVQAQAKKAGKSMTASGTVKSVTGTALTINASGGKEMTFTVDGSTKFVGKGLGTKARAGKLTAPDAVGENDNVSVTYHDMGGTMHAANVRINSKAIPKK
jgi:hypothetical protein